MFNELPAREWVDKLRRSDPNPLINPPIRLLDFFASEYDDNENPPSGRRIFDTHIAQAHSPALVPAGSIDKGLVERFIKYFQSSCWVKSPASTDKQIFL